MLRSKKKSFWKDEKCIQKQFFVCSEIGNPNFEMLQFKYSNFKLVRVSWI